MKSALKRIFLTIIIGVLLISTSFALTVPEGYIAEKSISDASFPNLGNDVRLIEVHTRNHAPTIEINYPEGVLSETVHVSWNISDPDGDNVTIKKIIYRYNKGKWIQTHLEDVIGLSGEADIDTTALENGFYSLRVVVRDEHGARAVYRSDAVEINNQPQPENNAPVVELNIPESPLSGIVQLSWSITDPDGDYVTFTVLASNDNGATWYDTGYGSILPLEGEMMYDTSMMQDGFYLIMINATNENGASTVYTTEQIEVLNNPANHAPVINYVNFPTGVLSGTVNVSWNVKDPDGDNMTAVVYVSYDNGSTWNDTGLGAWLSPVYAGELDTTSVDDGFYMIRAEVTDEHGASATWESGLFEIRNQVQNNAPVIEFDYPAGIVSGTINVSWSITDPDGDNMTVLVQYSTDNETSWIDTNIGEWADLVGEAQLDTTTVADGSYMFRINATDENNASTVFTSDVIEVLNNVQPADIAVTLTADPMTGVSPLEVNFTCSVENGTAPYTYSISVDDSPNGVVGPTDSASLAFAIALYIGERNVTCSVTDSEGATANSSVMINVSDEPVEPVNNAPVFDAIGPFTVNETEMLSFAVTATDADNDTVTITAAGLPAGAVFDGTSFTWTPDENQSGNYTVTL